MGSEENREGGVMLKRKLILLLGGVFVSTAAFSKELWIKDIQVDGLIYNEIGFIYNHLPFKPGDRIEESVVGQITHALYVTGVFEDIRVRYDKEHLLRIAVKERPIVSKITAEGMNEFSDSQWKAMLKAIDFYESKVFNPAVLDQVVIELRRQYQAHGYYDVDIKTDVKKDPEGGPRVQVVLQVQEGVPSVIAHIRFEGNTQIKRSALLKQMTSSETGLLSWFTKNNRYDKTTLTGDLGKIVAYYYDRGFVDVRIDQPRVEVDEVTREVSLTIPIQEGERYRLGSWDYEGEHLDVLRSHILWKEGTYFNRSELVDITGAMNDYFANQGFAKSVVDIVPHIDRERHVIDVSFKEQKGQRVYVRRIRIEGNRRTRDEVIRRELRQMEGALFVADKIKRSRERLDLLGLFEEVRIEVEALPDTANQIDLKVVVKERFTGDIKGSVGYEQGEGAVVGLTVSEKNFLGSGNYFAADVSLGKANQQQSLTIENPYFTDSGISLGGSIYHKDYDSRKIRAQVSQYTNKVLGASVAVGIPVSERNRLGFKLGVENNKLGLFDDSPDRYKDFVRDFGSKNTTVIAGINWSHDGRDSHLWPTKGHTLKTSLESALPLGDIRFNRVDLKGTGYIPLSKYLVLMGGIEVSAVKGYGKTKRVPFFYNYYLGGAGSVRGYDTDSIGPEDREGEAVGGTRRALANVELLFPIPGFLESKSVRGAVFFDAGSLWDKNLRVNDYFRMSSGIAFSWLSPLGPMRFSYGIPLRKRPGDRYRRFDFVLGSLF